LARHSAAAIQALESPAAPIVLSPKKADIPIAQSVAPGTHLLGILLPYTPIHHLLFDALAPNAMPLVITSGNLASEPLVTDNQEAFERLRPLCDALLLHDRPIERCVDDSVLLDLGDRGVTPIRRSRGYAPSGAPLPDSVPDKHPTGLCLGGELKNTIAVVRERDILVSQHLGDLSNALSYEHFKKTMEDLVRLFQVGVEFIAHDLHPNYMSTHAARQLAATLRIPLIPVQHHHAHAAAVMAEHGLSEALAIICDGTGFGPDGTIWGGELLHVTPGNYRRLGRLRPMRLPGGDAAAKDPRRCALSMLYANHGDTCLNMQTTRRLGFTSDELHLLVAMIQNGVNSPWSSSAGRLFDAVAAILGICNRNEHEAQAAMALEATAHTATSSVSVSAAEVRWNGEANLLELDVGNLVQSLEVLRDAGKPVNQLARAFHEELARGWVNLAMHVMPPCGSALPVVASGGCFSNRLLIENLAFQAKKNGFSVFFHKSYPTTDAGVAFGQAIVTSQRWLTEIERHDKRLNGPKLL
jgi:hydrogenase maturation protein HypF